MPVTARERHARADSLLARVIDPFDHDLPLSGLPEAAALAGPTNERLTDGFFEENAREYLAIGRGCTRAIDAEGGGTERMVVSWVEKARRRGILTRCRPGAMAARSCPGLGDQ